MLVSRREFQRKEISVKEKNYNVYLTSKDVCKQLSISVATLQRWRDEGKIKYVRLGLRSVRYTQGMIDDCVSGDTNTESQR